MIKSLKKNPHRFNLPNKTIKMVGMANTDSTDRQMKTLSILSRLSNPQEEIIPSMRNPTKIKEITIIQIMGFQKVEETVVPIASNGSKGNRTIDLTIKEEGLKNHINSPTPPILLTIIAIVITIIKSNLIVITTTITIKVKE